VTGGDTNAEIAAMDFTKPLPILPGLVDGDDNYSNQSPSE
jgi:hypothetical protein